MLQSLSLNNFIIVDQLEINFSPGFSVLTGETGAGKSIILQALALLAGVGKTSSKLIKQGAAKSVITGCFLATPALQSVLDEQEIAAEEGTVIIRRVLTASGSKAFINDVPVSLNFLKQFGQKLLDIHQQFDTQKLLDTRYHTEVLDTLVPAEAKTAVRLCYEEYASAVAKKNALMDQLAQKEERAAYLDFAISELETLKPLPNEEEELLSKRKLFLGQEKIQETFNKVSAVLGKGEGLTQLDLAIRSLGAIEELLAEEANYKALLEKLHRAHSDLIDAEELFTDLSKSLRFDTEETINELESRLIALRSLAKKHKVQTVDLPEVLNTLKQDRENLVEGSSKLQELEKDIATTELAYNKADEALANFRKAAAEILTTQINIQLQELHLKKMSFIVSFTSKEEPSGGGRDTAVFKIINNLNPSPQEITKAASGGELARIMLAIKVAVAQHSSPMVVLFDEIDVGVGGVVAHAIGQKLRKLADFCQVIAVTHSHQVAAAGTNHFKIEKVITSSSLSSNVSALDYSGRVDELARMLSANQVTENARLIASGLLEEATAK